MSELEDVLAWHIHAAKLPEPEREYVFAAPRKYRFDFAFVEQKVAVEVEGGHWTGGRHTRGAGFDQDLEKYATALIAGWTVLRVSGTHVKSGQALTWIEAVLRRAGS